MLGVPAERADEFAAAKSKRDEGPGQAVAAGSKVGLTNAQHRPTGISGNDLAIARPFGGVIEKLVDSQCKGLHTQAEYVK